MKRIATLFAAALFATAAFAVAETATTTPPQETTGGVGNVRDSVDAPQASAPAATETEEAKPLFSLEGKVEGKTAYFFRGYNNMDTGYIIQPELTLSYRPFTLGEYELTPYVGAWSNVSEDKMGGDSHWEEFDATAGLTVSRGNFELDLQYNYYTSPGDAFDDVHELGAVLTYSDATENKGLFGANTSRYFGPIALNPHVGLFWEVEDRSDGDQNAYLEFGLEPSVPLNEKLSLSFPVNVGTSLDSYYTKANGSNAFLGYISVGATLTYQINEHWSVYGGVEYLRLDADSVIVANSGERDKVIGTVGVGFSF